MGDQNDRSDRSDQSDGSVGSLRLRPNGGYRTLRSFRTTTVIYDATVAFCSRFLDRRSRTNDQMVQAARSGRQNIAEGSRASATSSQTELKLVSVARASLDELLLDYGDFLRQRGLKAWRKDDPEALAVREVGRRLDRTDRSDPSDRSDHSAYSRWLDHPDPAVVANTIICLIHQANYLLDQQILALEKGFIAGGGYREQLAAARRGFRKDQSDRSDRSDRSDLPPPLCPLCGRKMLLRSARQGSNAGTRFWGCSGFPACKTTRPLSPASSADTSDHRSPAPAP